MKYSENGGTDVDLIVGISLNGVPFFTGLYEYGLDAFYPKAYNGVSVKTMSYDFCLGDSSETTFYHYYSMSPCLVLSNARGYTFGATCKSNSVCYKDKKTYMGTVKTSVKKVLPVGIARDGHKIYGPFDASGSYYDPCDVDMCNGMTIDGDYVYVTTYFFPYTVGCFSVGN